MISLSATIASRQVPGSECDGQPILPYLSHTLGQCYPRCSDVRSMT